MHKCCCCDEENVKFTYCVNCGLVACIDCVDKDTGVCNICLSDESELDYESEIDWSVDWGF